MILQIFPWQTDIWHTLLERHQKNRLPQAWLFEGNSGIGKNILAKIFARQLLCQAKILCGETLCRSCELMQADTHPDFVQLSPEGLSQTIKIDMIRALNEAVFKTTHFKGYRVVIIEAADRLNQAASNALLKTLEEPPARVIFMLTTHSGHKISATIRSRCEKMLLPQPNYHDVKHWLAQQYPETSDTKIDLVLRLSQGAPLAAKTFLEDENLDWRESVINDFSSLFLKNVNTLGFSEKYKNLSLKQLLFWLKTITMDLIRCKADAVRAQLLSASDVPRLVRGIQESVISARIINIDKADLFLKLASKIDTEFLFDYLNKLYNLERKISNGFNLNHALVVDDVFSLKINEF